MPKYAKNMQKYAKNMLNMRKIFSIFSLCKNMQKICIEYAKNICKNVQINLLNMQGICKEYAESMQKICRKYAKSAKMCLARKKYAKNMQKAYNPISKNYLEC